MGVASLKIGYFYYMLVHRKKNRSGSTSIVVIKKVSGRPQYIKTIGISSDEQEIEQFLKQGQQYIHNFGGQMDMFVNYEKQVNEEYPANYFMSNIENVLLNGTQLILNQIYKRIGFDQINDHTNRAKKDRHNRGKGIKRLQQAYKSGKITKENINCSSRDLVV